jgi:hypothetical protein
MKVLRNLILMAAAFVMMVSSANAQCESWEGKDFQPKAMEAHVLYRGIVKGRTAADLAKIDDQNFNLAYNNWEKAFDMAPMADGKRSYHYSDGVELLKAKAMRTDDAAKKKELEQRVVDVYDQYAECFPDKKPIVLGRKAYDMFYLSNYGYRNETFDAYKAALMEGGLDVEYIILDPLGQLVKYLFENDKIGQEDAREVLLKAMELADHNIANNDTYGQYYESGKAIMENHIKPVELDIFDCAYFKDKLLPEYRANPDSLDVLRRVYNQLVNQGCDPEDPDLANVKADYEALASEINAQREADFLANNPGVAARRLYDEGDFEGAIAKYEEAIEKETDDAKKAEYYFGIASIQFRKMDQYSSARSNARKAADLKDDWGRPYMLIGDMYASTSSSCGNDGYSRGLAVLAAIDKYAYARSIDEEVAAEASEKIGLYNGSIPTKEDVFMRGKQGATERVGCWIGETVKVRYQ